MSNAIKPKHETMTTSSKELQQAVISIEEEASNLLFSVVQVTKSLKSRTALTTSHVNVNQDISKLTVESCGDLQTSWTNFLNHIANLRQHFHIIIKLAQKTALLKQQVMKLEAHVNKKYQTVP